MGVERVAAARAVEVVLEPLGRGHGGQLRLRGRGLLDADAVLARQALGGRALGLRRGARVELEAAVAHLDLVAVLELRQRVLEAPLADVAPGAHDVGPDLHAEGRHASQPRMRPVAHIASVNVGRPVPLTIRRRPAAGAQRDRQGAGDGAACASRRRQRGGRRAGRPARARRPGQGGLRVRGRGRRLVGRGAGPRDPARHVRREPDRRRPRRQRRGDRGATGARARSSWRSASRGSPASSWPRASASR